MTSLELAKVAVASFPGDKFKATRAAGTTHIVGINMDVKFTIPTEPSHYAPDAPSRDAINRARYLYTLELDASGTIIGGEWMQNAHPDILWTLPPGTVARSPFESSATGTWDGVTAIPLAWRSAAISSSSNGTPLNAIVQRLVSLSRQ